MDVLKSIEGLLDHCHNQHEFHLSTLQKRHGMDQYSFIRLINFIRSSNATSREVMDLDMPVWEQDKFMVPVIEDDPMLMYGMYHHFLYCFYIHFLSYLKQKHFF